MVEVGGRGSGGGRKIPERFLFFFLNTVSKDFASYVSLTILPVLSFLS